MKTDHSIKEDKWECSGCERNTEDLSLLLGFSLRVRPTSSLKECVSISQTEIVRWHSKPMNHPLFVGMNSSLMFLKYQAQNE